MILASVDFGSEHCRVRILLFRFLASNDIISRNIVGQTSEVLQTSEVYDAVPTHVKMVLHDSQ